MFKESVTVTIPIPKPVPCWDCCKIAFHTKVIDANRIWDRFESGKMMIPPGWTLVETTTSGARSAVAIFDVEGFPTAMDAEQVRKELSKIKDLKCR